LRIATAVDHGAVAHDHDHDHDHHHDHVLR
jgi:hypothetical protein